VILHDKPF
jgi:hypothetical protein